MDMETREPTVSLYRFWQKHRANSDKTGLPLNCFAGKHRTNISELD